MAGVGRPKLAAWMEPFRQGFTNPTWQHVLVLIAGAILSPGRRTVAAALRVTGLDQDPCFTNYHRVLNRNRWSSRQVARCLLRLLVSSFVPDGPVIIGLDDTLERRWGAKIKARGIYRDPVRSSHGHRVKASGPALALGYAPAGDSLGGGGKGSVGDSRWKATGGGARVGPPVPDRARPFGAICQQAQTDRTGS
jgi:hypothetical protein